ncbi:MAG TPA: PKD domain-containing protein, partial [Methylomirabilota bacterium]|nr:PKD domain-containing protein [Methylomirabilota bacterium]
MANKLFRVFLSLVFLCTFGLLAFPHATLAQTTLFSDNFTSSTLQSLPTYNSNYIKIQASYNDLQVYNGQLIDPNSYPVDYGYAGLGPVLNPCSIVTAIFNNNGGKNFDISLNGSPSSFFPGFTGYQIYGSGSGGVSNHAFYFDFQNYIDVGVLNIDFSIPHTYSYCLVDNHHATFSIDNTIIDQRDVNPVDFSNNNATMSYPGFEMAPGANFTNFTIEGTLPNQPPTVNTISNTTINEGATYSANGSFTDSDSTSWTATVDYGDGSGTQSLTLSGMNFSLSHQYKDEGTYTVTVTITDNQGATSQPATATITVNNATPTVGAISVSTNPVQINNATSATATFTDAGVLDTHTATWDWGDGSTPTAGTISESNGSGSVGADSHTYTTAGVYTITLTVTDDDGTQPGTQTFQ